MRFSKRVASGLFFSVGGILGAGCGDSLEDEVDARSCGADSDCAEGERCDFPAASDMYPRIMAVCAYAPCGASGECPEDLACMTRPPGSQTPGWGGCPVLVCAPRCTADSCPSGEVCRASGVCEIPQCDEPGIEACPEHFRCDPAAAKAEPSLESGSVIEDTLDGRNSIRRGCVRMRCDETNGYACREFWECAPGETAGGSGCVPTPCQESGHCENDHYICEPTSSAPRSPGTDHYGCVFRNCEEGNECIAPTRSDPSVAYCDPSAPNADVQGCALRTCVEGNTCVEGFVCDPDSPQAGRTGCVPGPDLEGSSGTSGTSGGAGGGGGSPTGGTGGGGGVSGAEASGGSVGEGTGGSGGGSGATGAAGSAGASPAGEGKCVTP
jgi:hypothetical protein